MENLELILSLTATASSLFVACISFLVKLVKTIRDNVKAKNYNELLESVAPIMEVAENYTEYKGADKKEFVMTKVEQYAAENGLTYDAKNVAKRIEELVEFSKRVNKREG